MYAPMGDGGVYEYVEPWYGFAVKKESDLLANQIVWPDNPETFWGYLAIQEATNSHEYERKADGVHETKTAKRENRDWSKEFEQ